MQLLCVCDEDAHETNFFYCTLLEVFFINSINLYEQWSKRGMTKIISMNIGNKTFVLCEKKYVNLFNEKMWYAIHLIFFFWGFNNLISTINENVKMDYVE